MSGDHKKKREKKNPLETPIEIVKDILSSLSRSPKLPDSPLKKKKINENMETIDRLMKREHEILSPASYSSHYSDIEDEIEENNNENYQSPLNHQAHNQQIFEEKPLIRLQEVKANDSSLSLEENKKNFESADSDFKRITKQKSNTGISPLNLPFSNESIHHFDSHLDISPNLNFPAFSKISEKSQEDIPSMEFLELKEKKIQQRKSEIFKHSVSLNENNKSLPSQWEKIFQKLGSSSKNLDNSTSFHILRTLNSFNSGKSKMSLENHLGAAGTDVNFSNMTDENLFEFFKNLKNVSQNNENFVNISNESKKGERERSPIINSLNNLYIDSPKMLSPNRNNLKLNNSNNDSLKIYKSISMEYGKNYEENIFTKKDSCSNFLNLEKTNDFMNSNSLLKNIEE